MTIPSNKEPGFKFVDKRRVDETGESRGVEEAASIPEQPMAENSETNVAPEAQADDVDPTHGPITFSLFVQSLAQQALMSMGLIPWPDTGLVKANYDHARETIDILTILHEKTQGNLTASEKRFFDTVLYELRVTFVELLKSAPVK